MTNKLTQTHISLLRSAIGHADRCVAPPNGWAATEKKSAAKMIENGWLKEIKAKPGASTWRKDGATGTAYSLKITAAGIKAAALNEAQAGEAVTGSTMDLKEINADKDLAKAATNAKAQATQAVDQQRTFREGTKLAGVMKLLQRDGGVTVGELSTTMNWQPHSTRAVLTGLRKRGIALARHKSADRRASAYFVKMNNAGVSGQA